MLNLIGLGIAVSIAAYTMSYAVFVWRQERNPFGAIFVMLLALSALGLPFYILLFRR